MVAARVVTQYQEDLRVVRPVVRRFDIEVGNCSRPADLPSPKPSNRFLRRGYRATRVATSNAAAITGAPATYVSPRGSVSRSC